MKKRRYTFLAILLSLPFVFVSCSKPESTDKEYGKHKMESEKDKAVESTVPDDTTEPSQRDTSVRQVATPTPTPEVIPMLSEQDIQNMNGGGALIVRNELGDVTTIFGRFFHRPVTDEDDAINAVKGVQELLGLQSGYYPFAVYGSTYGGYTFYTYQQIYDDLSVQNSALKVVLDPEGYPCMIQSSLATNLGYTVSDPLITESEAEQIVLSVMGDPNLHVYSDYTCKTSVVDNVMAGHCFEVITDNPYVSLDFDMPYLVHFVDYEGYYYKSYPTAFLPTDPFADYGVDSYFKDLEPTNYTFTIKRNGSDFTFTVPISYNSVDGKYYMADPQRKVMVADYAEFVYHNGNLVFESQDAPDTWNANHLITYYNYMQAYDFYKQFNIDSTDGFGMPILILTGWCQPDGTPENNACNMGVLNGWSVFGSSDINTYGYSLDIVGHEFTHGVTFYARQGSLYENESGAINEAYSDILGNIMEMYMGDTTDTSWCMGETSGNISRSMSEPYLYNQPMVVGDAYYMPSTYVIDSMNDRGGVHINNSIISHLCYVLYQSGMSLEDLTHFYLCTIEMHTPRADYDDFYAIYIGAAHMCGYSQIIPIIDRYWHDAGLVGDRTATIEQTSVPGYQRLNLQYSSLEMAKRSVLIVEDAYTGNMYIGYVSFDGVASVVVPANGSSYGIYILEFTDETFANLAAQHMFRADASGWTEDFSYAGLFTMDSGDVAWLPAY